MILARIRAQKGFIKCKGEAAAIQFEYGEAPPEVLPLDLLSGLLYHFERKRTPFISLLLTNGSPFTSLV